MVGKLWFSNKNDSNQLEVISRFRNWINTFFIRFQCVDLFRSRMKTEWMGVVYREHNLLFSVISGFSDCFTDDADTLTRVTGSLYSTHPFIYITIELLIVSFCLSRLMLLLVVSWQYSLTLWMKCFRSILWMGSDNLEDNLLGFIWLDMRHWQFLFTLFWEWLWDH